MAESSERATEKQTSNDADVPSLIADLSARDPLARTVARRALARLGRPAVPRLIRALFDSKDHVRWEAAKALKSIADPTTAPSLVKALEDESVDVRWLASQALVAVGEEALAPLMSALIEKPDSEWLLEGAHHVCHGLYRHSSNPHAHRMLEALGGLEPQLAIPPTAHEILHALRASSHEK